MPFEWSGVASAPDGRHGLLISPVTGIWKGGLRIAVFRCRLCPRGSPASNPTTQILFLFGTSLIQPGLSWANCAIMTPQRANHGAARGRFPFFPTC